MNKAVVVFLLFLIMGYQALSQGQTCDEELFPHKDEKRKVGYVNAFGEWKVIPFYTKAYPFRGKVAIVLLGTEYGVINCEGNVVFKPQFQELKEYSGGVTWAKKDQYWGLISDTGTFITDFIYQEINEVGSYTYVTWAKKNLKWQLLSNFSGKPLNNDSFDEVKTLNFQTSLVKKEFLIGLINNENGAYIIKPDFQKVFKIAPNLFAAIKNEKWFLYSDEGDLLTKTPLDSITVFGKLALLVKKEDKYGLLDYKGEIILPIKFDRISEPSNAHLIAVKNGNNTYFNIYGNPVKANYKYAEPFYNGVALAKDSVFKILNLYTKQEHVLPEYDTVYRQPHSIIFIGRKKDKSFLLNTKGEKIIHAAYDSVYLNPISDWIYLSDSQGCHYYNTKTNYRSSYYKDCNSYEGNYATAKKNNTWVIINQEGKELSFQLKDKPQFIPIGNTVYAASVSGDIIQLLHLTKSKLLAETKGNSVYACGNYFAIREKDSYKLLNKEGEEILKPRYDTIISTPAFEWPKIVSSKGYYNILTIEGDHLHKDSFDKIYYYSEQLFVAEKDNKKGILNTAGELLIPTEYNNISEYSEYYLPVKKGDKWGYINLKNQIRIPFDYLMAEPFKDQLSIVKSLENEYQVINKRGEILDKGYSFFLINDEGYRELRNEEYLLKIKEGKLIKSYNYK